MCTYHEPLNPTSVQACQTPKADGRARLIAYKYIYINTESSPGLGLDLRFRRVGQGAARRVSLPLLALVLGPRRSMSGFFLEKTIPEPSLRPTTHQPPARCEPALVLLFDLVLHGSGRVNRCPVGLGRLRGVGLSSKHPKGGSGGLRHGVPPGDAQPTNQHLRASQVGVSTMSKEAWCLRLCLPL